MERVFLKLEKFVNSDEGLPCVNTIEKVYLGLLVAVFALGILSFFRLVYFKAELRKVFDPRQGFTNIQSLVFFHNHFRLSKILTCGSIIKDFNGMESNRWKKTKQKNSKTSMEKIANANLMLQAISNAAVDGIRKLH